ncbi:MAG: hypothetical protein PVI59_06480 [Anaerolineae bacterium]|jgi:transcription initiation factor IIE alpha subunit
MRLFGRKKSKKEKAEGEQEEYVICPHCYVDYSVKQIQDAGGVCPSCKGEIDLDRIPRAKM